MNNDKHLIYKEDVMKMAWLDNECEVVTLCDIKDMEPVDALEVVRCKNCVSFEEKYRTVCKATGKVYLGGYCYHWDYEQGMSPNQVDGDDFCSYGGRMKIDVE